MIQSLFVCLDFMTGVTFVPDQAVVKVHKNVEPLS